MWATIQAALIGARLTCPACRKGKIYRSATEINRECPHCSVVFEGEAGDFLGAMVIAYSVTAVLVAAGIFVLALLTDLSPTVHLILWSTFSAIFVTLTYRNMKGMWIGILHQMIGLKRKDSAQ